MWFPWYYPRCGGGVDFFFSEEINEVGILKAFAKICSLYLYLINTECREQRKKSYVLIERWLKVSEGSSLVGVQ